MIARLCIDRITNEEIELLHEKIESIRTADSTSQAIQAAFEFQHEFALASQNTLIPLVFQSFKAPIFTLWERFCALYGIQKLYESNYGLWLCIKARDTDGAIRYIEDSMRECIDGDLQIYYD